jgi:tetratricopeptide (TPR) repeat protein
MTTVSRKIQTNMQDDQASAEFWHGRGCAHCEQAQFTEAIAAFDQAIALSPSPSPTHCQAWNGKANALSGLQRYAEALAAYDRAVAVNPAYHPAWYNRGRLLSEMHAYGNALESYERAIALHPDPRYLHAKEDLWITKKVMTI